MRLLFHLSETQLVGFGGQEGQGAPSLSLSAFLPSSLLIYWVCCVVTFLSFVPFGCAHSVGGLLKVRLVDFLPE